MADEQEPAEPVGAAPTEAVEPGKVAGLYALTPYCGTPADTVASSGVLVSGFGNPLSPDYVPDGLMAALLKTPLSSLSSSWFPSTKFSVHSVRGAVLDAVAA